MVDWKRIRQELGEAGYPRFECETGNTAVPGLSGAWVAGKIPREGELKPETLSLRFKILDRLPCISATSTDPERVPDEILRIAEKHKIEVIIVSVGTGWVRVALCDRD